MLLNKISIKIISLLLIIHTANPSFSYAEPHLKIALRAPLKFNTIEVLHKVNSEVVEIIKTYPFFNNEINRGSPLVTPTVNFIFDSKELNYKYDNKRNEILFYTPLDTKEEDFRKVCWLAYGEWLTVGTMHRWDEKSKDYSDWTNDEHLARMGRFNFINPEELKDKVVLDVASGQGIPGILIAKHAKKVICVDASGGMLEKAKEKADSIKLNNIEFIRGGIFRLPFADNSFDIVVAHQIFELYPEQLRRVAIEEIYRVLKPGGKFKSIEFYRHILRNAPKFGWSREEWLIELSVLGFDNMQNLVESIIDRMDEGFVVTRSVLNIVGFKPKGVIKDTDSEVIDRIAFYITDKCDQACSFCHKLGTKLPNGREISYKEATNIIDRLKKLGIKYITFTGGDPLLVPNMIDILKYAHSQDLIITLQSSGKSLDEELINKLENVIDELDISLEGASEEIHTAVRGGVSQEQYRNVTRLFPKLIGRNFRLVIATVANKINIEDLQVIARQLADIGISDWVVYQYCPEGRGAKPSVAEKYNITKEEFDRIVSKLSQLGLKLNIKFFRNDKTNRTGIVFINQKGDILISDTTNYITIGNIFNLDSIRGVLDNATNIFNYEAYFKHRKNRLLLNLSTQL